MVCRLGKHDLCAYYASTPNTHPRLLPALQGAAAYGFDPFFSVQHPADGCLPASSPVGQMTCAFWSARPFDLRFCSDESWIPWCGDEHTPP